MSHNFLNLAHRAAQFLECTILVDNTLDILGKEIEDKINACTSISGDPLDILGKEIEDKINTCTSTSGDPHTICMDDLFGGELVFW